MSTTRAIDRVREKIRAADSLGTEKILLSLSDVKEVVRQWEELTQRRSYEEYINAKPDGPSTDPALPLTPPPIIERRVDGS